MKDKTHVVEGFEVKDKGELLGVARGLRYAAEFCKDDSTDKASIERLAKKIEREAEWLF